MEVVDIKCIPSTLKSDTWYSLVPVGAIPSGRVGHTATLMPASHQVAIVGGATPDDVYSDVWLLDLTTLKCKEVKPVGDWGKRYEHCAFINPDDKIVKSIIWVFAGANMDGNKSDMWKLDIDNMIWKTISPAGNVPSSRTQHASLVGQMLTVFGGGLQGSDPVPDSEVYRFNPSTESWREISTSGDIPQPRHGHVLVPIDGRVFSHGGMAGPEFFDDLHILEADGMWVKVEDSEEQPCARAAHSAVYHDGALYLFGGLGKSDVLNDLWRLSTTSLVWEEVLLSGNSPPARLDFAMVLVYLPHHFSNEEDSLLGGEGDQDNIPCILLHGGMNVTGQIFEDFYVLRLNSFST